MNQWIVPTGGTSVPFRFTPLDREDNRESPEGKIDVKKRSLMVLTVAALVGLTPHRGSASGTFHAVGAARWLPFVPGDRGLPSLWHYAAFPSPERPGPDGLCEPSRGENGIDHPNECLPRCGDAVAQRHDGEDTATCPSDIRIDKHH